MKVLMALWIMLFSVTPLAAQPISIDRPTWTNGDTWTYREGNLTLTFVVRGETSNGYAVERLDKDGHHVSMMHWDRDLVFEDAVFFHPQWPLETGKQWQFTHHTTAGNGISGVNDYVVTETVVGVESVSVPAGTFQSIRIHGKDCNITQHNYCGDFDVWYAPQVKYTVRIKRQAGYWSTNDTRELVSYKVSP